MPCTLFEPGDQIPKLTMKKTFSFGMMMFLNLVLPAALWADELQTWNQDAFLPKQFSELLSQDLSEGIRNRANRIALPGITPGFVADPLGLLDDFNPTNPGQVNRQLDNVTQVDLDWFNISIGNDNPYLEVRQPGSPGGIGYYRVSTQMQVIDSTSTSFAFVVQAFTPAGLQNFGLNQGATTFCPSMSFFHNLSDGLAIQGFVGENMHMRTNLSGGLGQNVQGGIAIQRAIMPLASNQSNLYFFMEGLGRYRFESMGSGGYVSTSSAPAYNSARLDVLPGLQWKPSDTMSFSSGYVMPVGANRTDPTHLQITCSLQF